MRSTVSGPNPTLAGLDPDRERPDLLRGDGPEGIRPTLGGTTEAEKRAIGDTQGIADLMDQIHKFPRPTIAAAQGDALAGGAGLALAATSC